MYKIIGADGKEYGPVSADQIRQWIAEGRVNAQTRTQAEGSPEWRTLAEFTEFAEALKAARPPAPGAPKTSGMAIASLVLSILGFLAVWYGITWPALIAPGLGLALGLAAMYKIKKTAGQLRGRDCALLGVAISGMVLVNTSSPFLITPRPMIMRTPGLDCLNQVKQLGLAVRIYAADNSDRLPFATNWCDAIAYALTTTNVFQCPAAGTPARCHYAFNAKLSGIEAEKAGPDTVMIFESDAGWNSSGGPELLPVRPRHRQGFVVAFADGSARFVKESELKQLRWDPKSNTH